MDETQTEEVILSAGSDMNEIKDKTDESQQSVMSEEMDNNGVLHSHISPSQHLHLLSFIDFNSEDQCQYFCVSCHLKYPDAHTLKTDF